MRRVNIALMALLALAVAGCDPGYKWQQVSNAAGRFTVDFPGQPKEQTQRVATPAGMITMHIFIFESSNTAFTVMYNDYPDVVVQGSDKNAILTGARDGAVGNVGGTVSDESQITVNGHPGRQFTVSVPSKKLEIKSKIMLVDNRLYQVMVAGRPGQATSADTSRFLNSFVLQ